MPDDKQNRKLIPERRFKEFIDAGEWEEKKLSEVAKIYTGSTPDTGNQSYYSSDNGIPWVTPSDISKLLTSETNKNISELGARLVPVVPENTVLVTCIASIGKNTLLKKRGSFNQQINALVPDRKNTDPYFLLAESFLFSKKMSQLAASGTMQIVNKTEFSSILFFLPKLKEQIKIGDLYLKLDESYENNKKKYEKLLHIKAAYLAEMFPAEGETVPQRRFKGFEDEWENQKLDNISGLKNHGGTPPTMKKEYWCGNIPWLQSSDLIIDRPNNIKPNKFISKKAIVFSGACLIEEGSIAIVTRVGVGKVAILPYAFSTSQDFISISRLNTDIQFTGYYLIQLLKTLKQKVQGTAIKGILIDDLMAFKIKVPSYPEQARIGEFFRLFDRLIDLHEKKLEKLEQLKEAFLNELFV